MQQLPRPLLALVIVAVGWLGTASAAIAGTLVLDVLDIGQGDAILVRVDGKAVLIDAGPDDDVVLQLERLGVRRLDLAVGSHAHADHIGGMDAVLNAIDTRFYMDNGLVYTSGTYQAVMKAVEARRVRYVKPEIGREITLGDDAKITVLAPPPKPFTETRSDQNSNSVVLWLQHGDIDVLLTGDAEEPTEAWLVSQGVPDVEVLKVPHHGSDHSSTLPFLQAIKPEIALISCGRGNSYGHPGPEAMERLVSVGTKVYRTDTMGQIRVISDGREVVVETGSVDRFGASLPEARTEASPSPAPPAPAPPEEASP